MPVSDATREQRTRARQQLLRWRDAPLTLPRHVCLVPGWRDEQAQCWTTMAKWFEVVFANATTHVHVLTFRNVEDTGPPPWEDFLDFGGDLADYVHEHIGADEPVDFLCHSMGGLDTLSAIALVERHPELQAEPVTAANVVMTFDTPFEGFAAAGNALFQKFVAAGRKDAWVLLQLAAMEKESKRIAEVAAARDAFLAGVQAFWPRGADNYDGLLEVPHDSADFGGEDAFAPRLRSRYRGYEVYPDTTHSGTSDGLTHDLRAVREAVEVLMGLKT